MIADLPQFFFIYIIFMFFIMLNVFLAILNDSYLAERKLFMNKYGGELVLGNRVSNSMPLP